MGVKSDISIQPLIESQSVPKVHAIIRSHSSYQSIKIIFSL